MLYVHPQQQQYFQSYAEHAHAQTHMLPSAPAPAQRSPKHRRNREYRNGAATATATQNGHGVSTKAATPLPSGSPGINGSKRSHKAQSKSAATMNAGPEPAAHGETANGTANGHSKHAHAHAHSPPLAISRGTTGPAGDPCARPSPARQCPRAPARLSA